jgi:hypothetical protein
MGAATIGIRPHSGWAIVVAVTAPPDVNLLVRRRIEVLGAGDPRQPWHEAQERGLSAAEADALEQRVAAGARAAADAAIGEVMAEVRAAGHEVAAAGIVGEPRDLPGAEKILANHSLLHSAEGELFRAVLTDAAEDLGIPVTCFHAKAVDVASRTALFSSIRAVAGPPWAADHRLATAVALDAIG